MDPSQPVSVKRMLLWSILVILGVMLLAVHFQAEDSIPVRGCRHPGNEPESLAVIQWFSSRQTPVFFIRNPESIFLDIQLTVDTASANGWNPRLSCLTSRIIGSGTNALSAEEVTAALAVHGSTFQSSCHQRAIQLSLRAPATLKHLPASLELFRTIITQPDFSSGKLLRQDIHMMCDQYLNDMQQEPLAYRRLRDWLQEAPPCFQVPFEIISRETMELFFKQHFTATNITINLVGNITMEQAVQIAEEISARFPEHNNIQPLPEPAWIHPAIALSRPVTNHSAL